MMHFRFESAFRLIEKFLKNRRNNATAPITTKFGKVLACIGSNHQQNKIAIGGWLYICESGLCFYPHKFNWPLKSSIFEASWRDVQCIYKSSGTRLMSELFSGGRIDRLAFEINNKDQFFGVYNLDKLIEDINIVAQRNRNEN